LRMGSKVPQTSIASEFSPIGAIFFSTWTAIND
jgi:hypothetical protein